MLNTIYSCNENDRAEKIVTKSKLNWLLIPTALESCKQQINNTKSKVTNPITSRINIPQIIYVYL